MKRRRLAFTSILAFAASSSFAAPVPPAVRAEIDGLMAKLQSSGCEFNRNGSWYSAAQAKDHLLEKLSYLEGKDLVHSTEQFIERAATNSSMSGKPYLVRCKGATPVESAPWLKDELKTWRGEHAVSSSK